MNFLLLQITSLVYIILLNIFYFSKKHLYNIENRLYKYLLISNAFGLIIELSCFYTVSHQDFSFILNFIVTKLLLVYYLFFITVFTCYVFAVIHRSDDEDIEIIDKYIKKISMRSFISFIIASVIICYLPIEYFYDGKYVYSYGTSIDFLMIVTVFVMGIWLICLLKKIRILKMKKYIPIVFFILFAGIGGIIQKIYPYVLLTTPIETLVIFLMYFTIENPDINMIDEMHKAKEVTDTANEEKTMFLYNMTNELREITRDIDNEADNILNETDNKKVDIEHINNSAREIKSSTARFTTMTNEILDISAVDATSIKVYNDKYNIKLLIKELVQVYKKASEKKGIDFRTSIASDLPEYLYGDIVGLKNSLSTILDNSIEFTESGYIELSVNAIIKNDIARLIITVEDSGIGMKADELNKIFNKKSEDKEVTDLNENLYNARKLITLMGGTIIPSSVFGKGTTMKVVIDQKVFNSESDFTKYEKIYDKKRILLVDDSPAGVKIVTKMLNDTNIILDVVSSGKECLDKIRSNEKYDLILLDEEMSPLTGIEVMVKLKEIRNFNIKTILLTKNNDYEYNEEYLKYGFKDYLLKPLDRDKVFEKIDKYLK